MTEQMTEQIWRTLFAKGVKERMKALNMTQKDLANAAGITPMSVNRYLRCQQTARIDIVLRIAKALDCTVDDLIGTDKLVEFAKSIDF